MKAIKSKSMQTKNGAKYIRITFEDGTTEDFMLSFFDDRNSIESELEYTGVPR
jgi:hypothetical protein